MKAIKPNDIPKARLTKQCVCLALMLALSAGIAHFTLQRADAAASQFDETFGSAGKVFYVTAGGSGGRGDIEVQPDGKAVVVGSAGFEVIRFNVNGTPDNTFDGDGLAVAVVTSPAQANALAIQTDGKIVVAGRSAGDLALARFNANGSPDMTFDGDGVATLALPDSQEIFDIAIQPDGKIIVGGNTGVSSFIQDFMVVRFNANGTPDAAFGPTGIGVIQTSFNAADSFGSLVLQTDGGIVAGGYTFGTDNDFALLRITTTGSLDSTFDMDGKVTTSIRETDFLDRVLIQPDGKLVATGGTRNTGQTLNAAVVRYNTNGSLDASFDFDGIATTNDGAFEEISGAALQPDGKILVTERRDFNNSALIRFNLNGSLDTSFHGGGKFIFPASSYTNTNAKAIAIQPDGRIIVTGSQGPDLFLSRLLGDPRSIFSNPNSINPPDRTANTNPPGVPSNYPSIADINGLSGTVTKVRVTLTNVNHTFPGDFDILLVGPQGQRTILMSDAGGGNPGITGRTYIFDQSAAVNFPVTTAASGYYKPFNGDGPASIEPGGIDVFPAPGPGSQNFGAANLDVFNGTNPNGIWRLYVVDDEVGDTGSMSTFTLDVTTTTSRLNNLTADFDGDGKADVAVFRPSVGYWYISKSFDGSFRAESFGLATDRITPADFDGDGKTDVGVWRPSTGFWYRLDSRTGVFQSIVFGQNGDIPTPADFDGDGRADICVFRPSNSTFYLLYSSDGSFHFQPWGQTGDTPIATDYDGDGKADFGIHRGSASAFYYLRSSDGSVRGFQWGASGDKPIAVDFDADGKTDIAVYRPSTGAWYTIRSSDDVFTGIGWGTAGDIPSAGDYDGDGKADVAVFRPSTGVFYILQSTSGSLRAEQFGTLGDLPVSSAFVP